VTGVVITVDDAEVRARFAALAALGDDLTPVMDEIGDQLVTNTLMRFEAGSGPGGVPWKPSRRAQEQGGQTLVDRGLLRQSVTHQPGARGVDVGTADRRAAIHQFGGVIRAKTARGLRFNLPWEKTPGDDGWRIVASVTMPARPFIGFDDADAADTTAIVEKHIARITGAGTAA